MFNLDNITGKNDNNKDWLYRKLIIGPSGSGKTNILMNLEQKSNDIMDKIYLYAKDLEERKYQFLIKKRENAGIKNLNDPNEFIEYSNTMDDVYNNIDDYNSKKKKKKGKLHSKRKRKVFIVFDDMIAGIMTNKNF